MCETSFKVLNFALIYMMGLGFSLRMTFVTVLIEHTVGQEARSYLFIYLFTIPN